MIKPQDSLAMVMNPKTPERRVLAIVLALVAVAGLGFAAFSRTWMYNSATSLGGAYGFGPLGMFHDENGRHETATNGELVDAWRAADEATRDRRAKLAAAGADQQTVSDLDYQIKAFADEHVTSGAFPIFGWLAFGSCLLTALSLAVAVGLVATKKRPDLPIMPTTTALLGLMVALVTGCVFVATKPGGPGFVGVSFGFWGYGIGAVVGIGATLMLNRSLKPIDDELVDPMNADDF